MTRRLGLIAAWAAATLAATAIAVAAVGGVASSVVDEPGPTFPPAALAAPGGAQGNGESPDAATGADPGPDAVPRESSTTSAIGSTVTTTPVAPDPTTTTGPVATAPATTTPTASQTTYWLDGGSVTLTYGPGVVRFAGANPASGYTAEVESTGPDRVEVEFNGGGGESRFRADASDGEPAVRIDESGGDSSGSDDD